MNNGSLSAGWNLFRKDIRQLLPLLAILVLLAMLFYLLGLIDLRAHEQVVLGVLAFLGMPFLLAIGAGALLIGQEKELRTLYWMKTIPVSHSRIIATKLAVALVSLVCIWCLSLLLFLCYGVAKGGYSIEQWSVSHEIAIWDPSWPLNTLFIMLCGIALAWRLQSTFVSLLLIVPLAFLPGALSQLTAILTEKQGLDWILNMWLMIGIAVAGTYGWYAANRCLAATKPPSPVGLRSSIRTGNNAVRWESLLPQSPNQSLSWQYNKQNAVSLTMLFVALIVTAFAVPYGIWREETTRGTAHSISGGSIVFTSIAVAGLAASWLGILSFHGDRLHHRIRFLADRGVEPSRVWRSRHGMPVCIMMLTSLILMATNPWLNLISQPLTSVRLLDAVGIGLAYLSCFVSVYALSQWIGQWIQSPIVSAIVAPTFVAMIVGYYTYAVVFFDAPIWMVVVLLAIPMMATWRAMKRWMDGNVGLGFWLDHGAWLGILILLPLIPFLLGVSRVPRMPTVIRQEMMSFNSSSVSVPPFVANRSHSGSFQDSMDLWAGLNLLRIRIGQTDLREIQSVYRLRFEEAMYEAVSCRVTNRLTTQSNGEAIEILLIRELKKPGTRTLLGEELHFDALRWLSDSNARDDARKRALKMGWSGRNVGNSPKPARSKRTLGGYELPWQVEQNYWLVYVAEERLFETRVAHLWQLLRSHDAASIDSASEQVRADWYGAFNASDKTTQETIEYVKWGRMYPGGLWRGNWEREAVEMFAQVTKEKEGNE